jgi:hypothetical protein
VLEFILKVHSGFNGKLVFFEALREGDGDIIWENEQNYKLRTREEYEAIFGLRSLQDKL